MVSVELARRVGPGGAVTAIDFDGEALEIARTEALQTGLDNLTYPTTLISSILFFDRPVDVVYTRFVLTHLQDPVTALRRMAGTARPGGTIVVEDADASANFCHPPETAFDLYSRLYRETMLARGTDPDIGPKLPQLLRDTGFRRCRTDCLPTRGNRGRRYQTSCRPYAGQCCPTRVGGRPANSDEIYARIEAASRTGQRQRYPDEHATYRPSLGAVALADRTTACHAVDGSSTGT